MPQKPHTGAGKYRHRIRVMNPNRSSNDFNESVPAYDVTYCQRWAEIINNSGRELFAAQQVQPMVAAVIHLRSDEQTRAITTDMRIQYGSRVFNIATVFDEMNVQKQVVLWCTEVEEA